MGYTIGVKVVVRTVDVRAVKFWGVTVFGCSVVVMVVTRG